MHISTIISLSPVLLTAIGFFLQNSWLKKQLRSAQNAADFSAVIAIPFSNIIGQLDDCYCDMEYHVRQKNNLGIKNTHRNFTKQIRKFNTAINFAAKYKGKKCIDWYSIETDHLSDCVSKFNKESNTTASQENLKN